MPIGGFQLRLNKMHVYDKRSSSDYADNDRLYFAVKINDQVIEAPGNANGFLGVINSGDDVPLYDASAGSAGQNPWEIGPVQVNDDDVVQVVWVVTNLSYNDQNGQAAEWVKIVSAWESAWTAIAATAVASTPGTAIAGIVLTAIAGVFAILGEALGWLIGHERTMCDGLVLMDALILSGDQLSKLPYNSINSTQGVHTVTRNYQDQHSQSGCGHDPDTDVTYSIIANYEFGGRPQSFTLSAIAGAPADAWNGTWGDATFQEDGRILCVISTVDGVGQTVVGAGDQLVQQHLKSFEQKLKLSPATISEFGADPRSASSSKITAPPPSTALSPSGHVTPIAFVPRYTVDIIEHFDSAHGGMAVQLREDNLIDLPMQATEFASNVYPSDPSKAPRIGPLSGTVASNTTASPISHVSQTPPALHDLGRIYKAVGTSSTRFATTLVLSNHIALQLYGRFDQNHHLVDHCLRYLRTADDGKVLTDVMLAHAQQKPR